MESDAIFVHAKALNDSDSVGAGTRIWAFAHVLRGAVVGRNCNLGDHVFVEGGARIGDGVTLKNGVAVWEGVVLEDFVFVGPYAVFTNDRFPRSPRNPVVAERYASKGWLASTRVCHGAAIGASATILCGLTIGRYAMVAAGSMVTRDVAPFTLAAGNPARTAGRVCACGHRLTRVRQTLRCDACARVYTIRKDDLELCEGSPI